MIAHAAALGYGTLHTLPHSGAGRRVCDQTAARLAYQPHSGPVPWRLGVAARTIEHMTSLGLALLVVGSMVAIAEAHHPTHGIAGGLGVAAVAVGVVLLISGLGAGLLVALLAGALLAASGAGAVVWSVREGLSTRRRRVRTGAEGMIGQVGVVRSWDDGSGRVALGGALWSARRSPGVEEDEDGSREPLHAGDRVVVERVAGLTLSVRRAEEWELL